jgi:hypothetical protein
MPFLFAFISHQAFRCGCCGCCESNIS